MSTARNVGLFVALSALWGFSFPAITAGLESLPPLLFAAFRYDLGGILLLAYLAARGRNWLPRSRSDLAAITVAGAFIIAGGSLLFIGQRTVSGGIASIIYALIPLLTAGGAAAMLPGEPLTRRRLLGIGLGLVGVGIIARPAPGSVLTAELVGIWFVLAAAVSVSLGSVLLRRLSPTLGVGAMTAWAMLGGGGLLHVGSYAVGERFSEITPTTVGVVSVVYLAVFASSIAYLIYFVLLEEFGPLEINLVSYVVPVFATVGGVVLLGEELTIAMFAGFGFIATGFVVLKVRVIAAELGYG